MEHLQAALRASASEGSSVETMLLIARHVGYFAFLSYDAIGWVCRSISIDSILDVIRYRHTQSDSST
jgi:hypothetical protein